MTIMPDSHKFNQRATMNYYWLSMYSIHYINWSTVLKKNLLQRWPEYWVHPLISYTVHSVNRLFISLWYLPFITELLLSMAITLKPQIEPLWKLRNFGFCYCAILSSWDFLYEYLIEHITPRNSLISFSSLRVQGGGGGGDFMVCMGLAVCLPWVHLFGRKLFGRIVY